MCTVSLLCTTLCTTLKNWGIAPGPGMGLVSKPHGHYTFTTFSHFLASIQLLSQTFHSYNTATVFHYFFGTSAIRTFHMVEQDFLEFLVDFLNLGLRRQMSFGVKLVRKHNLEAVCKELL